MSYIFARDERLYLAKATDYKTIRNTGGAASVVGTDAALHKSFTATPSRTRLAPPDKESTASLGYIDRTVAGRFNAAPATISVPLYSASAAGAQPDAGILFESAFGKATVSAGVSVTYGPAGTKYLDEATPVAVEAWEFVTGGKRQKAAVGIVNRLTISGGADYADVSADLLCFNVLTQDRFAAASTAEKMGLTAWPSEPATQTYTGSALTAFTGSLTLDGNVFTKVRSFTLTANFNRLFRADKFATDGSEFLPSDIVEGSPEFTLDVDLFSETANANLDSVIAKIAARTAFDASLVLGNTAGGTYTIPLNNLIKPDGGEAEHVDGDDRKVVSIRGLRAQITTAGGSRDECSIILT